MMLPTAGSPLWALLSLAIAPKLISSGMLFANAAATAKSPAEVDVVVVGGGYSGLTSGYELHKAGLKTAVLEASGRIGGRSRSHKLDSGGIIELGATWINNKTQPEVFKMTQDFGLDTAEQPTDGLSVFENLDGEIEQTPPEVPINTMDPVDGPLEGLLLEAIMKAEANLTITTWHTFPEKQDVTFDKWLEQQGLWEYQAVRGFATQLTTSIVGRDPDEVGAHYFLDYIKSGNGIVSLASEGKFGAQSLKIKQGTTAIPTKLAEAMEPDSVHLGSPVISIKQKYDHTLVKTKQGQTYKAKKVIMAIPSNKYGDIEFDPPLPCVQDNLISNTMPGIYAKMIISYAKPWWSENGLVGKFTSHVGPINFSWDTSDDDKEQYSLAMFIAGGTAAEWHKLPDSERQSSVVEHLARLVGDDLADEARNVLEINYVEWTKEEFLGGAPTSSMKPGMLRLYGKSFRESFDSIHFAGAEWSYEWKGYLEGAVLAGQTAAKQVIRALRT